MYKFIATASVNALAKISNPILAIHNEYAIYHQPGSHAANISAMAVSPVHNLLALGSDNGQVTLHDTKTYRIIYDSKHHQHAKTHAISALTFSPDGQFLVASASNQTLTHIALLSNKIVANTPVYSEVRAMAYSPDGRLLAMGLADHSVRILKGHSTRTHFVITPENNGHHDQLTALAWNTNSDRLITASLDGTVKIWALPDYHNLLTLQSENNSPVKAMALSADNQELAIATNAPMLQLFNLKTESSTVSLPLDAPATCLACSPDGRYLAAALSDNQLIFLDRETGTINPNLTQTLENDHIHGLAFTPDGNSLAVRTDDTWLSMFHLER